jgi:2-polyprenyl-6-methoxyphenol hydroxylase-like FAD-dependent oxidoreductase
MVNRPFGHAAVVGSGIAGLMAARVLSDFFAEVTLLERDSVPSGAGFRRGIPQGRHFHGLIPGGMRIIMELLPGVAEALRQAGSLLPAPDQIYYYLPDGKSFRQTSFVPDPPPDTGDRYVYVQTRGLLEHWVRAHVEAIANVSTRYETTVDGVIARDGRVAGLTLSDADGEVIETDLLVDATGRNSKTLQWMERLGFERPVEEVVSCDFAYTTMFMRPRDPEAFTDVCFLVLPDPKSEHPRRGGGLIRVEGGLWMVAAGGRYGDFPPTELDGLMDFFKSLHHSRLYDLVTQADVVEEPAYHRFPRAIRRRFEKLGAFPGGLLPIGDAICHSNPVYGQGMAAACRQAKALQGALSRAVDTNAGLEGLSAAYFPEVFQETRAPWLFASAGDFRDSLCKGDFPMEDMHLLRGLQYLSGQAAQGDEQARRTLEAIVTLETRIDVLEQSPWRERITQSK